MGSRPWPVWLFTGFFIFMSMVAIPRWNGGRDFLFFSAWSLFSSPARQQIHDLSWEEEGQVRYFFRDRRKDSSLPTSTLFYLVMNGDVERVRKDYAPQLKAICHCSTVNLVTLKSSLFEHIVLKQEAEILDKELL